MTARARVLSVLLSLLLVPAAARPGQDDPRRAQEIYRRALEYEKQANYGAALPLLWEAAGLAPRDADVQNRLGEALERIGALDAAAEAYRRALAERPEFRKAANNLILTLVKAGRGPEAVERARAIVMAAPKDPDAHFSLGLAQSEQDVEQAIGSFRRALDLDPRHTLARYNLALVLKRADRVAEAVTELTRTLEVEPRAETHYQLGVIRWQQGDLDRAAASLRAAVSADPRHAGAQATLGAVLRDRRDWRGAIAALRRAIDLEPESWSVYYTLGRVLQLSGDARAARTQFAEAERRRRQAELTREAGVLTAVGTSRLDAGDPVAAVRQFEQALAVFDAYAPAHYQLGRALQRLGRLEAARRAFVRAHQLNPGLVPPGDVR